MKNKKGTSLSLWTQGILFSMLIVIMMGIVVSGFNNLYGKNNQIGLITNDTMDDLIGYQDTLADEMKGGEAEFTTSQGLTLKSSWAIIKSIMTIIWDFISGGWIETLVLWMKLPLAVALIFRMLYFISIGLIILYILFKVKP